MRKDFPMHPTILTAPEKFDAFVRQALKKGIFACMDKYKYMCLDFTVGEVIRYILFGELFL